jgi:DNA polymerase III alpha subunit (gram-positive type)
MNLLKEYIKLQVKQIVHESLDEGQIERSLLNLEQLVDKLKDKTLIFLDTETTGLGPRNDYVMITQIAAVAYDTRSGKKIDQINYKANLSDAVKKRMENEAERVASGAWAAKYKDRLTIDQILKMTAYHSETAPRLEEKEMMEQFLNFIRNLESLNPLLVAHNARFDMYQIGKALERNNLPKLPRLPVVDTLTLNKNYFFPLLKIMEKQGDPVAEPLIRILRPEKKFLNRLGNLGTAFQISTEHWHDALADVEQLAGILSKLVEFFEERKGTYNIP